MAALLHWGIAIGLIAQIVFGFALDDIAPRNTPARAAVINLHKSLGITLGLLILARLAWRLTHAAPAWPASMSPALQRAALLGHRALYACMLVLPLAGYTASNFSKHGVKFFGIALPPWGPNLPDVYAFFNRLHVYAAWLYALLILGHVLIACKHAFIDRDGSLRRIWPWQRSASSRVILREPSR